MALDQQNPAEVFSRPNAEARIHDLEHFLLWAETPDRPGFRSRMVFGERNGAPRVTVFPNTEANAPVLWAGYDPQSFFRMLSQFEAIIKGENGQTGHVENMGAGPSAERGKMPKESDLIVRNVLHFGKSQEGIVWIALEQQGTKNIRFLFTTSMWHHFLKADGSPFTPSEASVNTALSFIETMRIAFSPYIARIRPLSEKGQARADAAAGASGDAPSSISTFSEDVRF